MKLSVIIVFLSALLACSGEDVNNRSLEETRFNLPGVPGCGENSLALSCTPRPGEPDITVKECRELSAKEQSLISAAQREYAALSERNQSRKAAIKNKYTADSSQFIRVSMHMDMTLKDRHGKSITLQAYGYVGNALTAYQAYEMDASSLSPHLVEEMRAKLKKYKYAVFLESEFNEICGGPASMQSLESAGSEGFVAKKQDGNFQYIKIQPQEVIKKSISSCAVDDGIRCAAVSVPNLKFFLTNNPAEFTGEVLESYRDEIIKVQRRIVNTY